MRTRTQRLNWRTPRNKSLGQGMAEYIIIVALVAVAGIATWQLVGSSIGQSAAGVAGAISGTNGGAERGQATATAAAAATAAANVENLSNYADANGTAANGVQ